MSARREVVSAVTERFPLVEPNADPIGHHPLSERLRHVAIFVCMGKIKIDAGCSFGKSNLADKGESRKMPRVIETRRISGLQ